MNSLDKNLKKPKIKTASKPPEWMPKNSDEQIRTSMKENRDLWITAANFDCLGRSGADFRLSLIMNAKNFSHAKSLAQWRYLVEQTYGSDILSDVKAAAFYHRVALVRLLELSKAPHPFIADASELLNTNQPQEAPKRGDLQAALIDHPHLANDPAELARKASCSRRLVDRYLRDGSVQKMP